MRHHLALGAFLAFAAVGLGAMGAHALESRLGEDGSDIWDTAVLYHLAHAISLLFLSRLEPAKLVNIAGWLFVAGVLCFSGSLYALALDGPRWLGPITPVGGVAFLLGWLFIFLTAVKGDAGSK